MLSTVSGAYERSEKQNNVHVYVRTYLCTTSFVHLYLYPPLNDGNTADMTLNSKQ